MASFYSKLTLIASQLRDLFAITPPYSKPKLLVAMLYSVGFLVMIILLLSRDKVNIGAKIFGYFCIALIGFGLVVLTWQLFKKIVPVVPIIIKVKDIASISVKKFDNSDKEILEEWGRIDELDDKDLQNINAIKSDHPQYPWSMSFGATDWIREEPYIGILCERLNEALVALPGISWAVQEDRDYWVLEGEASGDELVRAGAVAVDKFLSEYRDQMLSSDK